MRHHPRIAAIVLNVDERWRVHDPSLPEGYPFPFCLYRGNLQYLANLLRARAIMYARKRIDFALGLTPPADPCGYFDDEIGPPRYFHPADPPADAVMPGAGFAPDTYFQAIEQFDRVLAASPAETLLIIVVPPVYQSFLLSLAPQVAPDLPACKAAPARRVADRPRSGFLDFMVDGPISRYSAEFIDPDHYRRNIARIIEANIVVVLGAGKPKNEATAK